MASSDWFISLSSDKKINLRPNYSVLIAAAKAAIEAVCKPVDLRFSRLKIEANDVNSGRSHTGLGMLDSRTIPEHGSRKKVGRLDLVWHALRSIKKELLKTRKK